MQLELSPKPTRFRPDQGPWRPVTAPQNAPRQPRRPSRVIDSSLARGIARAYFRALDDAWDGFSERIRAAQRRNGCLAARITTEKALDARWANYMQLAGGLTTCTNSLQPS